MINSRSDSSLSLKDINILGCQICGKIFESATLLRYGIGLACCWEKFVKQINTNETLIDVAQYFKISTDNLMFPLGSYLLEAEIPIPDNMQSTGLRQKKTLEMLKVPLQRKIIYLHTRNVPYRIIAEQFQVGKSTIKRLMSEKTKKIEKNNNKNFNTLTTTYTFLPKLLTTDFKAKNKNERNSNIILDYIRLNSIENLKKTYHCGSRVILRVLHEANVNILSNQARHKILNTMNIKYNSHSDNNELVFNLSNPIVIENFQQARIFFHSVQDITDIKQILNLQYIINSFNSATEILMTLSSPIEDTELKQQLILDYFHFTPTRILQATYHQHISTIMRVLRETGIETINGGIMNKIKQNLMYERSYLPINAVLEEILIGELLGDGNISLAKGKKKFVNPSWEDYFAAKNFLQRLLSITSINQLSDLGQIIHEFNTFVKIITSYSTAEFNLNKAILEYHWVKRIGYLFRMHDYKAYIYTGFHKSDISKDYRWKVYFRSSSSIQLKFLHDKWYTKAGRKIIPQDLKLTPRILLHWYIGDGSLSNTTISLATYSFTREEVELLAKKIEMDANIKFNMRRRLYVVHNEYREYWRLDTRSKEEMQHFFEYINTIDDKETLEIAKKIFPWKFNHNVRKREVVEKKKNTDWIIKMYLYRPKSNRFFYAFRQSRFFLNHNKSNRPVKNFSTLNISTLIKKNKL